MPFNPFAALPNADQIWFMIQILLGALLAAALGCLLFVNRRVQCYRGKFFLDVPVDVAWKVLKDLNHPNGPILLEGEVMGTHHFDEVTKEHVGRFDKGGFVIRERVTYEEPPCRVQSVHYFDPNSPRLHSDIVHTDIQLTPVAGGTQINRTHIVERRELLWGFFRRLLHPLMVRVGASAYRYEITRRRAVGELPPAPAIAQAVAPATWYARLAPTRTQAVLAIVSFASLMLFWSPIDAAGVWLTILIHEYGHVWAMRRCGMATARFYFLPLFGGVAVGDQARDDAQNVFITLMGPAFGLLPPLAFAAVHIAGREGWFGLEPEDTSWAGLMAYHSILVNCFNLIPVVPLDGGHIVHAVLRPLTGRAWLFISGLAILGVLVTTASSSRPGTLVSFLPDMFMGLLIMMVLWAAMVRAKEETEPLAPLTTAVTVMAYAALGVAHVGAIILVFVSPNGPVDAYTFLGHFMRALKVGFLP